MYKKKIASIVATTAFLFLQPALTVAADCSTDENKCSIFELSYNILSANGRCLCLACMY